MLSMWYSKHLYCSCKQQQQILLERQMEQTIQLYGDVDVISTQTIDKYHKLYRNPTKINWEMIYNKESNSITTG